MQKLLPISIATVGTSALAFQMTILEPYHEELDAEFKQIRDMESQDRKFFEFETEAMQAVNEIDSKVNYLMKLKTKTLFNH